MVSSIEMTITVEAKAFRMVSKSGGVTVPLGGVITDAVFAMLSSLQFNKRFIEFLDHSDHKFLVRP
jgi:hypothetical protein